MSVSNPLQASFWPGTESESFVKAFGHSTYINGLSSVAFILAQRTLTVGLTTDALTEYSPNPAKSSGCKIPFRWSCAAEKTPA